MPPMTSRLELIEQMNRWMLQRGWDRLVGKERSFRQTLYHHVQAQLGLIESLRPLLERQASFGLTDREVDALLVAALLHDMGKEREPWQSAVSAGRKPPGHVVREDILRELPPWSKLADPQNTQEFEDLVVGACGLHHAAMRTSGAILAQHLSGGSERRWKMLQELYADFDAVVSCGDAVEAADQAGARWAGRLSIRWHEVKAVRGVSSALLNGAAVDAHVAVGWTPVLYFIDGTVYAALPTDVGSVQTDDVEEALARKLAHFMSPGFELKLVFGDPTAKFLVKPEFVDLLPKKIEEYLFRAFRRMSPKSFERQNPAKRSESLKIVAGRRTFPSGEEQQAHKRLLRELGVAVCLANVLRWFKALCLRGDSVLASALPGDWECASAVLNGRLPNNWRRLTMLSTLKPANDFRTVKRAFWDNSVFHAQGSVRALAPEEQAKILISFLMQAYRAAYTRLDPDALLPRVSPVKIAATLIGELRIPEITPVHLDFTVEGQSYSNAKASRAFTDQALMCPLSNETCPPSAELTGTDLVAGTDKHTNRRRIGSKTWKDLGGFPIAPRTRLELLLRSVLLQSDLVDARLLAIIPPKNVGPVEGEKLLEQVRLLDAEFLKATDPSAAISERQVAVTFTRWVAANIEALGWDAGLPEIALWARKRSKSSDKDLEDAILELLEVPVAEEPQARESIARREREGLQVMAASWGLQFESWPEAVAAFRDNTRQDVRRLLNEDEALREVREKALKMRRPTVLAETPNAVLFLLPQSLRVKKESAVDTAIRELFLAVVFARGTNCPCALLTMDEPLTFTGGEGMVRIPRNASLRSHIANWRASQRTAEASQVAPLTQEWLLAAELDVWAEGLLAAHLVTQWTASDDRKRSLFPGRSPLYDALRIRSAGALVRRAEQRKVRTRWTSKELDLITNLAKVRA